MKEKSSVQEFADSIEGDLQKYISWAEVEILEYKKLIKILKKRLINNK